MSPILATAGLSMLGAQYLAMVCALPPVIIAEVIVARNMLRVSTVRAAVALIPANLVSTVIGFPLLWLLLFVIQGAVGAGCIPRHSGFFSRAYEVTVQAPWLIPHGRDLNWMVPVASLYLLIPAFFASVFVERWICSGFWGDLSKYRRRQFSWYAHFVSYGVLVASVAAYYTFRVKFG